MRSNCLSKKKAYFSALVRSNTCIGYRVHRISFELDAVGSTAFSDVKPGCFAEIQLSHLGIPDPEDIPEELQGKADRQIILRRPFSFCDIRRRDVTKDSSIIVDMVYCVVGPATLRMTTLKKGNKISMIGPLGNGFEVPDAKKYTLLIAGGMGAPPMQHLAGFLKANHPDMQVVAFAGAKGHESLPFTVKIDNERGVFIEEFAYLGVETHVATDDGSAGYKGFVTDQVDHWLADMGLNAKDVIIYGCGPEPMLASTTKLAEKYGIDCQISMERMMACGIGLCQSCAVEAKEPGQTESVYKLCCKDGPVFDSKQIVFGN